MAKRVGQECAEDIHDRHAVAGAPLQGGLLPVRGHTWDPHEPWDAPAYYTELYMPDYDGELVLPLYGNWHDMPGYQEAQLRKGHATYCGEITMVDTWVGYLLKAVENMGLADK